MLWVLIRNASVTMFSWRNKKSIWQYFSVEEGPYLELLTSLYATVSKLTNCQSNSMPRHTSMIIRAQLFKTNDIIS